MSSEINNKNDIESTLNSVDSSSQIKNKEESKILLISVYIILTIFLLPIIICDFYYGINDNSCVKIYPDGINITMKDYLITCSLMTISILIMSFISIYMTLNKNLENDKFNIIIYGTIPIYIIGIFVIAWHIAGSVIFWGTLYPEHICNTNVSTYLFVTLIIKLISCFNLLYKNNGNK
jgi:hypothetical protein